VHRSWWVNASHVVRIRARGDGGVWELSDGSEVPISRRRKAAVVARFGGGARYRVDASTLSNQSGPED
jgi:DNA-binding LytR/AlgR family response regulator